MEMRPFGWIFTPRMKNMTTIELDEKEIVLCRDCRQWNEESGRMGRGWCGYQMKCTGPNYFCADGEKPREGDDDDS